MPVLTFKELWEMKDLVPRLKPRILWIRNRRLFHIWTPQPILCTITVACKADRRRYEPVVMRKEKLMVSGWRSCDSCSLAQSPCHGDARGDAPTPGRWSPATRITGIHGDVTSAGYVTVIVPVSAWPAEGTGLCSVCPRGRRPFRLKPWSELADTGEDSLQCRDS